MLLNILECLKKTKMEINKLISDLEHLHNKGVRTIKLIFCEKTIEVKKLLDEIKLCNPSKG